MNILENEFEAVWEIWSDPGDYPSNAGGYRLPDQDVIVGVSGKLVIELEEGDINPAFDEDDQIKDLADHAEIPENIKVEKWAITRVGNRITFIVENIE